MPISVTLGIPFAPEYLVSSDISDRIQVLEHSEPPQSDAEYACEHEHEYVDQLLQVVDFETLGEIELRHERMDPETECQQRVHGCAEQE